MRGDTQVEGVDFNGTFSFIIKMTTVRTLIFVTIKKGWPLYKLDISNAFLYGDLDEEVFM